MRPSPGADAPLSPNAGGGATRKRQMEKETPRERQYRMARAIERAGAEGISITSLSRRMGVARQTAGFDLVALRAAGYPVEDLGPTTSDTHRVRFEKGFRVPAPERREFLKPVEKEKAA